MPNPKLEIEAVLNDKASGELKNLSRGFRQFGNDLKQLSREVALISGSIVGGFTASFAKAQKDLPAITNEFKSLNNSIQAMADAVAVSALPTLQEFTNFINNLAVKVKDFSQKNQELVNSTLKYSAMTLAIVTVTGAFGQLLKAVSIVLKPIQTLAVTMGITQVQITLTVSAVLALADALLLLSRIDWKTNLKNFALGGMLGFSGGGNAQLFQQQISNIKASLNSLFNDTNSPVKRGIDNWGKFAEGFKTNLKSLQDNIKSFGQSVQSSFESAFSDTLFDAITGKIKGLSSVIKQLGQDILRAGLRNLVNAGMGELFGTADGGGGGLLSRSFPSMGGIFGMLTGRGGRKLAGHTKDDIADVTRDTSKEFEKTTKNLEEFQKRKDSLMQNFTQLGGVVTGVGVAHVGMTQRLGQAWSSMTAGIGTGFMTVIQNLISFTQKLLSMVGGGGKGYGWWKWLTPLAYIDLMVAGISIGSYNPFGSGGGGLPSGAGISGIGGGAFDGISLPSGAIPAFAKGGIVTRPTLALIGESGSEAVVPLEKSGKFGSTKVDIYINEAVLNNPSNMREFVNMLKEEIVR